MRVLITGGAGFVGSRLALNFKSKYPGSKIVVFDNLKRRGSEINLSLFKDKDIDFYHCDIRNIDDVFESGKNAGTNFDLFIEASAEPSVLTGTQGSSPHYAIQTNLMGTINCLEFARLHCGNFLFLSTSRVYSIPALQSLPLKETHTRFMMEGNPGFSESFSTDGYRSLYGSTKLASEMIIQEYVHAYGLNALINRCGVICGPGQFGKVDQGVFTLWVAHHFFGKPLKYTGFGGKGKQVRDMLHPDDLFDLLQKQISDKKAWNGDIFNIGGGENISTSLLEWTTTCQKATGREVQITSDLESASVDVPYYVSDFSKAQQRFGWVPKCSVQEIARDINYWINENEKQLKQLF